MSPSSVASRRHFLHVAGALSAATLPGVARSQSAPLKLLISWPAGGLTDSLGRLLAEKMALALKRPVLVENKAGAGGQIGTALFKGLPPDGESVLLASLNEAMLSAVTFKKLPYQPDRDLLPVSLVCDFPFVLATKAGGPTTLAEFAAFAKERPKDMSIGCAGLGTPSYFHGLMLGTKLGFDANMIPFAGGAPLMNALAGGQVVAAMNAFGPDMIEMHRSGRTRIIGITGEQRHSHPDFVGVSTFTEAGLPTIPGGWFGLYLPAGAKPAMVQLWSQALADALASPEIRARLADFGLSPRTSTSQALAELMRTETGVWGDIVKRNKFEPVG